tara:strand:+ start:2734 stop:3150 length:417 start_codon:yes stop_codon:yes gene_type:complete
MNLDYSIPLLMGLLMLAIPSLLLTLALRQRPTTVPVRYSKAYLYRARHRGAYSLSKLKVYICLAVSLFSALVAGMAMATWLPMAPAESALLAILAAPLLWAAGFVVLLLRMSWQRDCLITLGLFIVALVAVVLPLATV